MKPVHQRKNQTTKFNVNEDMPMLEMTLHSKKLSYDRLYPIITQYIPVHTGEEDYDSVNILIDIESVIKKLYQPAIIEEIYHMKKKQIWQITSEIINICAHYRHFFASRLCLHTNIFLYYSDKKSNYHTAIYNGYRQDYYEKRLTYEKDIESHILNKALKENLKLIEAFLDYVPNICCINSGNVEPSLVPYMLLSSGILDEVTPTIFLSNETIYYQDLVYFPENTIQLVLRGDKSKIVTRENIWNDLGRNLKSKGDDITILPDYYPILLSIIGYKEYGVDSYNKLAVGRGIKFLEKYFIEEQNDSVFSACTSMEGYKDFLNDLKIPKDAKDIIYRNYRLLSHQNQELLAYRKSDIRMMKDRVDTTYYSPKEVKSINEKYFQMFPILIDYLYEGEEY